MRNLLPRFTDDANIWKIADLLYEAETTEQDRRRNPPTPEIVGSYLAKAERIDKFYRDQAAVEAHKRYEYNRDNPVVCTEFGLTPGCDVHDRVFDILYGSDTEGRKNAWYLPSSNNLPVYEALADIIIERRDKLRAIEADRQRQRDAQAKAEAEAEAMNKKAGERKE